MKNILTILIFLLFLTSPLSVQYTQTGLQFQREVLGKELCEDDDEDCKEDEDEDEDGDDDKDGNYNVKEWMSKLKKIASNKDPVIRAS